MRKMHDFITTRRFYFDNSKWIVYAMFVGDSIQCYLQHSLCGDMLYMFGLPEDVEDYEDVLMNCYVDYIDSYVELYFDDDEYFDDLADEQFEEFIKSQMVPEEYASLPLL